MKIIIIKEIKEVPTVIKTFILSKPLIKPCRKKRIGKYKMSDVRIISVEYRSSKTPENDKSSYYHSDYSVKLDAMEVYDKFVKEYEGVQLTEFELSLKRQGYVYELEGMTSEEEVEAQYDASNGDLVELERDTLNPDKEKLAKEDLDKLNDFLDLAFNDAGDSYYLKELTLKTKNGIKLVEVEVLDESGHEIEYKYDFASKELLEKD